MVELSLVGLNLNRIFNGLVEKGVVFEKIVQQSYNSMVICVSAKQLKIVKEECLKNNVEVVVLKDKSFRSFFLMLAKRSGFILGAVLTIVTMCILSSKLLKINVKIDGSSIKNEDVLNVIYEENINVGSAMSGINAKEIENLIVSKLPSSSVVVVNKNGVVLDIYIKEIVLPNELESGDIVAGYDGVIEEIKLVSGSLEVNIGDAVCKGQTLIKETNVGDYYVEARGSIIAKVLISGDAVGSLEQVRAKRSGKFVEYSYLECFGIKKQIGKLSESDAKSTYDNYECEITEKYICKNNLLPIKKIVVRYYEICEECVILTVEELQNSLKEQSLKNARANLAIGAKELSVSYNVIEESGLVKVVCNIETKIDIACRVTKE